MEGDQVSFAVVHPSGFVLYFLHAWTWTDCTDRWLSLRSRAQRFTAAEARRIADLINARRPGAPVPVEVRRIA